jgi:hypothetical protein
MEAFGTADPVFVEGMMGQLADVASNGQVPNEQELNFTLYASAPCGPSGPNYQLARASRSCVAYLA